MIKKYPNLVSRKVCAELANDITFRGEHNILVQDTSIYTNGTYGAPEIPAVDSIIPMFENKIRADYGQIRFINSYSRIYTNGTHLAVHTDRDDLEITMSLCVYNDTGIQWPMYISTTMRHANWNTVDAQEISELAVTAQPHYTDVGDAIVCLGTKNPHWRDVLTCEPGKKIIQIFYHWRFV